MFHLLLFAIIGNITHLTALRLGQPTHFNPPISSKVIHIQSLRDYFNPFTLFIFFKFFHRFDFNRRSDIGFFKRII